jgi:hypothetical protein
MRRAVGVAFFLSVIACSMGKPSHPGEEAPPPPSTSSELDAKCDLLGAPIVSAGRIMDCVNQGLEEARCMEPFWADYLKTHTTKDALALLQCYADADPLIRSSCHPVSHAIGRQTFVVHGTIDSSFAACDQTCIAGCYHGVMERFLRGDSDSQGVISLSEIQAKAVTACAPTLKNPYKFQCLHGLGHAIMYYTGYSLKPSLTVCDALSEDWDRRSCWGGVFMENIVGADSSLRDLSPTDYQYPCDSVDPKYGNECYMIQTSRMTEMGLGTPEILKECQKAGQWRPICIQSMGRDLSNMVFSDSPRAAAALCELGEGEDRASCTRGIVYTLVDNTWDARFAMPFCTAYANEVDVETCFEIVASYMALNFSTSTDAIIAQCMRFVPTSTACVEAARNHP